VKIQTVEKTGVRLPHTELWINGKWVSAVSGRTFETLNPATEAPITRIAEAGEEDIDRAVKAARKAFDSGPWPRMKPSEREKILRRIAALIREQGKELAYLETADSGKPLENSVKGDIPAAAEAFEYYGGWADKLTGETIPADPEYFSYTLREPLGVIGAITPWNFPLVLAAQKVAPALAVGNTVVLKPAEQTPLTALRLAELSAEAGLPEGVLNVVPGFGPTAGRALVSHPEVDGISFTGEYVTGQEIMKNAAGTLKRISFELGGKSANIVFSDANLDEAAEFACDGIFFNQGEVCCAGSRLFVEEKIKKPFREKLLEEAKRWKVGDPLSSETKMGPLVSEEQLNKVLRYVEMGQKEGAELCLDGRREKKKGYFIGPTLFTEVRNEMRLAQEEVFGPVLAEIPFNGFDEVLNQANQTFYGLAAAVWTRDIQKAHRAARALRAGAVWVNCYGAFDHAVPFGGYKMSGFGREGGIHTFDFYTQTKSVWIRL
jgi:acyl-CoA reductase-like NAD-dependent aldehyde dehydrogenase